VLWHDVQVDVDDGPAFDEIGRLAQRADHALAPQAEVRLTMRRIPGHGYQVFDAGDLCASASTADGLLDIAYGRVYRRATELASLKGWVRVHGALATCGGRRFAIIGPGWAGKSTLAVGLLCRGANVEVDESFVTLDGQAFGVARRFHIKEGTAAVTGAGWLNAAPTFGQPSIWSVDPTEHGFAWELPVGPVDAVVLLRRTDGPSRLEPVPATEVVREMIGQTFPLFESRAAIVRQIATLVAQGSCHVLHAGPDGNAPALLEFLV
jgi:hypothetical protein